MRREEPCLPVRRFFRGGRTWRGTRRKGEKCQVRQAEGSLNSAYCISFRKVLLALTVLAAWRAGRTNSRPGQKPKLVTGKGCGSPLPCRPPPRGLDRLKKEVYRGVEKYKNWALSPDGTGEGSLALPPRAGPWGGRGVSADAGRASGWSLFRGARSREGPVN